MQNLEKILEEIENERTDIDDYSDAKSRMLSRYWNSCIDVVEDIIRKHMNDGWIPTEERLPKIPIGTDDSDCPEFNVTVKGESLTTTLRCSWDGAWFDDNGFLYDVIAWCPLPKAYHKTEKDVERE